MLVVVAFFLFMAVLSRLRLEALLWLPALFCAVAAMHWTASLHLPDPLAPLYAFVTGFVLARIALELARLGIRNALGRPKPLTGF